MVHYTYIGKDVHNESTFFFLLYFFKKGMDVTIGFLHKIHKKVFLIVHKIIS